MTEHQADARGSQSVAVCSPVPSSPGNRPARPVVLAVDDNPFVRTVVRQALSRCYDVISVENGLHALPHLPTADIVVTDIAMPEMDGFTLADHVRAQHPDTPIVFVSSFLDGETLARATERSPHLLHKPFDIRGLLQTLREVVALKLAS